ncbi:MAG: phospho-N-acetylmuramoyl-pentapeptide-transferase [bacterium]|nr:phospho-N-acetylmuramoyl-pentapeptide-transferase [bacterium]MDD5755925.1 phospho-N-acetylmuramoyl-pentapeptide-transferase [bacterium]
MFYHLLYPLHNIFSPFNIFQYITFRSVGAALTALVVSLFITPGVIRKLRNFHIGQHIRVDGPQTHLKKEGTPTMGGVIILVSMLFSTLLWARLNNRFIIIGIFSALWLGLLGFYDDYLKLVKRNPRGLSANYKLLGQVVLALIVACYLYLFPVNSFYTTKVNVPLIKMLNLGILYIPFVVLMIVGASNAVNLTDGLDGLAIGNIIFAALTYAVLTYVAGNFKFASYLKIIYAPGTGELTVLLAAMIGAGLGFLWYNAYPAEIFMGDTGSLFLGGTLGVVAVCIKHEVLLGVVGGIFVLEALSVILQVGSFRLRAKRIFKMAPIHHHFELKGWSEPKVVVRFWIVGIILAFLAIATLKLR